MHSKQYQLFHSNKVQMRNIGYSSFILQTLLVWLILYINKFYSQKFSLSSYLKEEVYTQKKKKMKEVV